MASLAFLARVAGFAPLALCMLVPGIVQASPVVPIVAICAAVAGLIVGHILSSIADRIAFNAYRRG